MPVAQGGRGGPRCAACTAASALPTPGGHGPSPRPTCTAGMDADTRTQSTEYRQSAQCLRASSCPRAKPQTTMGGPGVSEEWRQQQTEGPRQQAQERERGQDGLGATGLTSARVPNEDHLEEQSGAAWRAWDERRRRSYPSTHLIPTVPRRTQRKGDGACRVQSRGGHPITFISF